MTNRIRFALLLLAVLVCAAARTGGASARAQSTSPTARTVATEQARRSFASRATTSASATSTAARRRASGFDCSGFTRFVYAHFGITLPHYSGAQFDLGRRVSRGGLRPGDLLFFDGVGHVGLYIGHGLFIHAPHTGTRVSIDPLAGWYAGSYDGARCRRLV